MKKQFFSHKICQKQNSYQNIINGSYPIEYESYYLLDVTTNNGSYVHDLIKIDKITLEVVEIMSDYYSINTYGYEAYRQNTPGKNDSPLEDITTPRTDDILKLYFKHKKIEMLSKPSWKHIER